MRSSTACAESRPNGSGTLSVGADAHARMCAQAAGVKDAAPALLPKACQDGSIDLKAGLKRRVFALSCAFGNTYVCMMRTRMRLDVRARDRTRD